MQPPKMTFRSQIEPSIKSYECFMFLQNSLKDARIQNEFTHAEQLLKKYAKQSLTSQAPIQINFSHNSPNTTALIYTMSEDDYSRFNKTDCEDILPEDPDEHSEISETINTFSGVFITACDGSKDLNDIDSNVLIDDSCVLG